MRCAYCTMACNHMTATRVLRVRPLMVATASVAELTAPSRSLEYSYVCSEECGKELIKRWQNDDLAEAIVDRWDLSPLASAQLRHLIREHRELWERGA